MNTRPFQTPVAAVLLAGLSLLASACSSIPPTTKSGFLSSYSSLQEVDEHRLRYVSPDLRSYSSFMVDPVHIESLDDDLRPSDRAEIARYCRDAFVRVMQDRGFAITSTPGPYTGRLRIALTSIEDATWWKKIHPASGLLGAGRGGAAMEAEIVDSTTGVQLAAVVQSGVGDKFKAFNISTVSDVKNTIDVWAEDAAKRFERLRAAR